MQRFAGLFFVLIALVLFALPAEARVTSLDGASLGEHWDGPAYSLEDLEGRVVLFELWGYNCPPCRASLPHLAKLQEKYRDLGFVVIGSHVQNEPREKVLALCREKGVNFTITSHGRPQGDESRGIPQAYLFDWTGRCVAEGHPNDLYSRVDELMRKAPHFLTRGRTFASDDVTDLAGKLKRNRGFGKILKKLAKLAESDEEGAGEAQFLYDSVLAYGKGSLEKAKAAEADRPLEAMRLYDRTADLYKRHDVGDRAKDRMRQLKRDDAFQKRLEADQLLAQMQHYAGQLKAVGGKINPDYAANRKPVREIRRRYALLQKKYADTPAAERARDMIKSLGF